MRHPDGREIVRRLEELRTAGASREELLREAVRLIEASTERFHWVGIYLLEDAGEGGPDGRPEGVLVLHNYLGKPTEHTRIPVGAGVCGTAVAEGRNLNVPDVQVVENYLACSLETRSELVVLIRDPSGRIRGQIDLDSDRPAAFTETDETELSVVADWLGERLG